jgi:hypothetical protein
MGANLHLGLHFDCAHLRPVAEGTPNAAFQPMTILLICWCSISLVGCLAFLSVAARATPPMDTQITPGGETALTLDRPAMLQNVKTASVSAQAMLPSSCQTA